MKIPNAFIVSLCVTAVFAGSNLCAKTQPVTVKGGDKDKEITFTSTDAPFTVQANAALNWKFKTATVSSSSSWSTPGDVENDTSVSTTLSQQGSTTFAVVLYGDMIPPSGGGSGPVDYKVKGYLDGEFSVTPLQIYVWKGENASENFKSKTGTSDVLSFWTASPTWTGYSELKGANNAGTSSISIGKSSSSTQWAPSNAGKYIVTAKLVADSTKNANVELFAMDLSVKAGSNELTLIATENSRYAYITASCTMPSLRAKLIPTDLPEKAEYSLIISYSRSGRNDTNEYNQTIDAKNEWNINRKMKSHIRGGKATLKCKYQDETKRFIFYIRGYNPTAAVAATYITDQTSLWYAKYVAKHESGYKNFNDTGTFNAGNSDIKYTPNASSDHGFGIFQLTNPVPTAQQLWSWKANCDEGVSRLTSAQTYANSWMNAAVGTTGFPRGGQRVQALNETGSAVSVPNITYDNVTFSDGTARTIEHAVAIKRFNGTSLGNFCAWDNAAAAWKFNKLNSLGFNYVSRVCAVVN